MVSRSASQVGANQLLDHQRLEEQRRLRSPFLWGIIIMDIKQQLELQKKFNNGSFQNADESGSGAKKKPVRSKQPAVQSTPEPQTQNQA